MDEKRNVLRPSKEGTITKVRKTRTDRKTGRKRAVSEWRALFRYRDPATGVIRTRSRDCKFKVDAKAALEELRKEAGLLTRSGVEKWAHCTVHEWLLEWHRRRLDPEEGEPIRVKTVEGDLSAIKKIRACFGEKPLAQLATSDIQAMMTSLRDKGMGRGTREKVFGSLRLALAHAQVDGLIVENPADATVFRLRKREPRKKITSQSTDRLFSRAELRAILSAVDEPAPGDGLPDVQLAALIHLLAGSALRVGEALGLTWADIDTEKGTVRVSGTLTRDPSRARGAKLVKSGAKTASSLGTIPLDDGLTERLRRFKAWRGAEQGAVAHPTAFAFLNSAGKPCIAGDLRKRQLHPLLERAGVERGRRSFHAFRHSHLSHSQEAGIPLAAVAKRARHANPGITSSVYTHSSEEADRAAADAWRQHLDADEGTHG